MTVTATMMKTIIMRVMTGRKVVRMTVTGTMMKTIIMRVMTGRKVVRMTVTGTMMKTIIMRVMTGRKVVRMTTMTSAVMRIVAGTIKEATSSSMVVQETFPMVRGKTIVMRGKLMMTGMKMGEKYGSNSDHEHYQSK